MDSDGFAEFVGARYASLLRTAVLLAADQHSGEDLLQTVLTNVYVAWPRIRKAEAAESYVRRALVTGAISQARLAWRRREAPQAQLPESSHTDYDRLAEASVIAVHLRALPARQRAVLVLRYFEDLSEGQTADLLGVSMGTVKSQAHDALHTLRERLAAHPAGPSRPHSEERSLRPGGAQ